MISVDFHLPELYIIIICVQAARQGQTSRQRRPTVCNGHTPAWCYYFMEGISSWSEIPNLKGYVPLVQRKYACKEKMPTANKRNQSLRDHWFRKRSISDMCCRFWDFCFRQPWRTCHSFRVPPRALTFLLLI